MVVLLLLLILFPDGFYFATTGWIFEISLCENSIKNQSIKRTVSAPVPTKPFILDFSKEKTTDEEWYSVAQVAYSYYCSYYISVCLLSSSYLYIMSDGKLKMDGYCEHVCLRVCGST